MKKRAAPTSRLNSSLSTKSTTSNCESSLGGTMGWRAKLGCWKNAWRHWKRRKQLANDPAVPPSKPARWDVTGDPQLLDSLPDPTTCAAKFYSTWHWAFLRKQPASSQQLS